MPRLVSVGNVIVDVVLRIDAIPSPGADTIAHSSVMTVGGEYNALAAARRDGLECLYAGRLGTGRFADMARDALAGSGIAVTGDPVPDLDTGYAIVLVDDSAERTFVTSVGAEGRLTPAHLGDVVVRDDDVVLVSGYGLAHPANAVALPPWLESLSPSVRVVFDPSPLVGTLPADALDRVLRRTDVLTANAREARLMTGDPLDGSPAAAALTLVGRVRAGGAVVVRDGPDGCWVSGSGAGGDTPAAHVAGYPVDAVDTTGAGDTHTGVVCATLARGASIVTAVQRGSAAAAIAVTRHGPAVGPTAVEIDALVASTLPDHPVVHP